MTASERRYTPLQRVLTRLKRGAKRGVLAGLTRLVSRSAEPTPNWQARTQKVLFLRHDRIGDMIVSSAVLRAIAQAPGNIELHVLASRLNVPVIAEERLVSGTVVFDRYRVRDYWRLWRHFRRVRYDVVVDPTVVSQSLTTLLLMLATGAPHRVGIRKEGRPNVYTMFATPSPDGAQHMIDHLSRLAEPFGVPPSDAKRMGIVLTDAERAAAEQQWGAGRRMLVNISAGATFRRWPDECYVAVAQHLRERAADACVLVMHGPSDRARAESIARAAGADRAETPTVRDALALVGAAHFVFTPDTSIVHAASAFRVPIVAIFTSDKVTRWRPYGTVAREVVCDKETLRGVSAAEALRAVDAVLTEAGAPIASS
jgi:ADP-heptose:LPS heptosyltransferase